MIQGCSGVAAGVSRDVLWGYFRDARGGIWVCCGGVLWDHPTYGHPAPWGAEGTGALESSKDVP